MFYGAGIRCDGRKHSLGVYPLGYRASGEGRERDTVAHPDEQPVVALIVKLRSDGTSYRVICAELEERGMPARGGDRWYPSAVRKIVVREAARWPSARPSRTSFALRCCPASRPGA